MRTTASDYNAKLDDELAALFHIGEPVIRVAVEEQRQELNPARARAPITIGRALSALLVLGILACIAGFFLFVPALSAMTTAVLLSGLLVMFWIGFHLGGTSVRC